jgi:hypothetical protein
MILNIVQLLGPMCDKTVSVFAVSKPKCSGIHIVSKTRFLNLYSLTDYAPNSVACWTKCLFGPLNHTWSVLHSYGQQWSHSVIWFVVQGPCLAQ